MASSALAQHPDMTETLTAVTRLLVLLFLVSSMSGIGLGLTLSQIIAPLRNVRLIVLAVIVNFIVVPLLAVGLARLLRLDEPFALGLLLLGLAAGAPFLPKVVSIANGDVASAVGLMVLLMVGTTVFLPVALPLLIKGVQVNPWKIARFLTLLMLIPLVAGLIVRARAASLGARARPVFEGLSTGILLLVLVLVMAIHFQGVLRIFGTGAIFAASSLPSSRRWRDGWLVGRIWPKGQSLAWGQDFATSPPR